jgi:hypothetical protein
VAKSLRLGHGACGERSRLDSVPVMFLSSPMWGRAEDLRLIVVTGFRHAKDMGRIHVPKLRCEMGRMEVSFQ